MNKVSFFTYVTSVAFFLFFLAVFITSSFGEVCKFAYKGQPEDFQDSTIVVPTEMVAMSEYQYVGNPTDTTIDSAHYPSIMFVIDHSGSMYRGANAKDKWGNRFNVTRNLVDTVLKYSPYADVGLTVFNKYLYCDPNDDPIFEQCPEETKGAYIPLLRLNKEYNGKKGFEIIKHYLETDTVKLVKSIFIMNGDTISVEWDTCVMLEYKSAWEMEGETNINAGFNAAKHSMLASNNEKKNHFVIFLSDGEATVPIDGTKDDYIKGVGVPTTFTVFFVSQGNDAPPSLENMTDNIKANAYSISNPKSNLWAFKNTNLDTLMDFLMENVINQILKSTSLTPTKLTINNGSTVSNWDSTGFTFNKMFPLLGTTTDFNFVINYHVVKDTVNDTGGVVTMEFDSIVNVNFDVVIDDNEGPLSDELFDVQCWDRKIEFYHNKEKIEQADETMSEIEMRFREIEVDILYGYKDVYLEMTSLNGKNKDKETLNLSDNGSYFYKVCKLEISDTPIPGDGILQVNKSDYIVATFRNEELILDTLRDSIPFLLSGLIEIKSADYFDEKRGDGLIDSIFCKFEGTIKEEQKKEIVEQMVLPQWRKLKILDSRLSDGGIALKVEQDSSADTITFVTNEDILKVKEKILDVGGWLLGGSVPIGDKIEPLIEKAHLIDYQSPSEKDTLTIAFSEKIRTVNKAGPFLLKSMKKNGIRYSLTLENIDNSDSIAVFHVISINGDKVHFVRDADSIWIAPDDNVGDNQNNYQDHPDNRRRAISVTRKLLPFTLIPKAVTPVMLHKIQDKTGPVIPQTIITSLHDENKKEIEANDNTGMLIQVVPDNIETLLESEFHLRGTITIFDAVGNIIIEKRIMGYHEKSKSLNFVWICKNTNTRYVGIGSYLAYIEVISRLGPDLEIEQAHDPFQIFLGIKE